MFSLHHHHHHRHHIFIVSLLEFGLLGLILASLAFRGKTIEMWRSWRRRKRRRRENNNNVVAVVVVVVVVVEGKQ